MKKIDMYMIGLLVFSAHALSEIDSAATWFILQGLATICLMLVIREGTRP